MIKKLNNKGYMLVEIILAFVLAIGVTYFMFELIIKLKNRNDDLIVKTLVSTDQAIIYNTIIKDLYKDPNAFSCDKFRIEGNKFSYGDKDNPSFVNIISEYADVGEVECNVGVNDKDEIVNDIVVKIPIKVKQLPKESFDVDILFRKNKNPFYVVYSENDNSLKFYKNPPEINISDNVKVYYADENDVYTYDKETGKTTVPWTVIKNEVTKVEIVETGITPKSTANWFNGFSKCSSFTLENLNTSNLENMSRMFDRAGTSDDISEFKMSGLENFNTSKVTDMMALFQKTGYNAKEWNIGNLKDWDTSNVKNMSYMFGHSGYSAESWSVGDLSKWDTSNVTTMEMMFGNAGFNSVTWSVGDLDTKEVSRDGKQYTAWDVSNVTNMMKMFASGIPADNLESEERICVATTWNIGDLSDWNVSNVKNMNSMFQFAGCKSPKIELDLSNWDVSNVENMKDMFYVVGSAADVKFELGDLSKWNTSHAKDMTQMFYGAGFKATNWGLNLSGWKVDEVTSYSDFNTGVSSKVIPPNWVN